MRGKSSLPGLTGSTVIAAALTFPLLFGGTDSSTSGYVVTRIGEQRTIELTDGSLIILNTDSVLKKRTLGSTLSIDLLRGEAFFAMRPKLHRQMVVSAGGLKISHTATLFAVQLSESGRVKVTVQEGEARLSGTRLGSLSLHQNQQALADIQATQVDIRKSVDAAEIARQLSWRDGLLIFRCTTLSDAASEFNRYNLTRIEVDTRLSDLPVVGSKAFSTTDPRKFVETVSSMNPGIQWDWARNAHGESILRLHQTEDIAPGALTPAPCGP